MGSGPVLSFMQHEDGQLTKLSTWFPLVMFSPELLHHADGEKIAFRGDEVIIRCLNGSARYRLGLPDAQGLRSGQLAESW